MNTTRSRVFLGALALLGAAGCSAEQGRPTSGSADPGAFLQPAAPAPVPAASAPRDESVPMLVAPVAGASPAVQTVEGNPSPAAPPAAPAAPGTPPPADPPAGEAPPLPEPLPVGPEPNLATRLLCTGEDPISCHLGGPPGNYEVSVVLGGDEAATTAVFAEARRVLLRPTPTRAGESRRFSFVVNVREPEGEPIQNVPAGTPGLDLYFRGSAGARPALRALGVAAASAPLVIYVAGDSTVADQTDVEYGGWGQQLPQFFDYPVAVANYADSGESSGSFLGARPLFGAIEALLKPSDWVLIQFGHNDKQVTADQFHDNLTALVTRVQARGALPMLLTPVARAQFDAGGVAAQHINGTGANLPQIVLQVAEERGVPVFDLTARTSDWLAEVGANGWQAFHALGTDVTHTNDAGAAVEAGFVRDFIVQSNLATLQQLLR